jgi:hypothetical protein
MGTVLMWVESLVPGTQPEPDVGTLDRVNSNALVSHEKNVPSLECWLSALHRHPSDA